MEWNVQSAIHFWNNFFLTGLPRTRWQWICKVAYESTEFLLGSQRQQGPHNVLPKPTAGPNTSFHKWARLHSTSGSEREAQPRPVLEPLRNYSLLKIAGSAIITQVCCQKFDSFPLVFDDCFGGPKPQEVYICLKHVTLLGCLTDSEINKPVTKSMIPFVN